MDFDEDEQYYPEYLLFLNRTNVPHNIDEQFIIIEESEKKKLIRIGQGYESSGSLENTIKVTLAVMSPT